MNTENSHITPKSIIECKKKYKNENLFKTDDSKIRQNKDASKPAFYIPILMKTLDGTYKPPYIDYKNQLLMRPVSNNKNKKDGDDNSKSGATDNLSLTFRRITMEDLEYSNYISEEKKKALIAYNEEFIDALDIMEKDLRDLITNYVLKDLYNGPTKKVTFNSKKVDYFSFKQTEREVTLNDKDYKTNDNGKIDLDKPRYYIKTSVNTKLPSCPLGYNHFITNKHVYNVFDATRTIKEHNKKIDDLSREKAQKISSAGQSSLTNINNIYDKKIKELQVERIPAGVFDGSVYEDLNINNVNKFLTLFSVVSGTAKLLQITCFKAGISYKLENQIIDVVHHKKNNQHKLEIADLEDMNFTESNDDALEDDETNITSNVNNNLLTQAIKNELEDDDTDNDDIKEPENNVEEKYKPQDETQEPQKFEEPQEEQEQPQKIKVKKSKSTTKT